MYKIKSTSIYRGPMEIKYYCHAHIVIPVVPSSQSVLCATQMHVTHNTLAARGCVLLLLDVIGNTMIQNSTFESQKQSGLIKHHSVHD